MTIGTVKFFNEDKGYGFIQPDDGSQDSFVHISAVQAAGMDTLSKDQRVSYVRKHEPAARAAKVCREFCCPGSSTEPRVRTH